MWRLNVVERLGGGRRRRTRVTSRNSVVGRGSKKRGRGLERVRKEKGLRWGSRACRKRKKVGLGE